MSSDPNPLKKGPIEASKARQARTYAEFLEHMRGCAVVVDDILKRFPETRAKHEDLIKRVRLDCPGAPWASETICRVARKIQNNWGQYRPDAETQAMRDAEENNWRQWAVQDTPPPLPTTEPDRITNENAETEANAAWADICKHFQEHQAKLGGKEALTKIVSELESYRQRFGDEEAAMLADLLVSAADIAITTDIGINVGEAELGHALGEATSSANEEK